MIQINENIPIVHEWEELILLVLTVGRFLKNINSWIASILHKMVYRFSVIPSKIPMNFSQK
jgi:hypothetical protein